MYIIFEWICETHGRTLTTTIVNDVDLKLAFYKIIDRYTDPSQYEEDELNEYKEKCWKEGKSYICLWHDRESAFIWYKEAEMGKECNNDFDTFLEDFPKSIDGCC